MNAVVMKLQNVLGGQQKNVQVLAAPILVVCVLALMVLPLLPFMLDLFFTFNIATSLMVMMIAATMLRPLDFAAFAERHPMLFDKRLLTRFYRSATLAGAPARTGWVEPDLAPFPWSRTIR